MNIDTKPDTLFGAAKRYWKNFVLAWLFPIFFYYSESIAKQIDLPFRIFFTYIDMPIYFFAFIVSIIPWVRRKILYKHITFWALLFPFMIWVFIVFINIRAR